MTESIDTTKLKQIVEAALMAAHEPLTVDQLSRLFTDGEVDSEEGRAQIRDSLKALESEAEGRGYELKRVASGYRYQVRQELSRWVSRLWEEKPPRYSRALLETLALIAYKQPVTRGDIEQVRGVAVSQNIMRTLLERGWIRVVGQREVPGKPSLYGTTRAFLDYFDLKSLDQLPPLAEIRSLIEPLVLDAEDVAEDPADHQPMDTEPSADAGKQEVRSEDDRQAGVEPLDEAEWGSREPDEQAAVGRADAEVVEETEETQRSGEGSSPSGEGSTRSADGPPRSADVVRLPTTPRR